MCSLEWKRERKGVGGGFGEENSTLGCLLMLKIRMMEVTNPSNYFKKKRVGSMQNKYFYFTSSLFSNL